MYYQAFDKLNGLLVGFLTPKPVMDEPNDYGQMEASIRELDGSKPSMGETVFILVVPSDWPQPNAKYRKQFAALRDRLKQPMTFALISSSPIIRGVVTAVNWVSPPRVGTAGAFASVDDAIAAAEKRFRRRIPELRPLCDEVLAMVPSSAA